MTREAGFKRRVRARMARTGEAYSAARAHLESGGASAGPGVLHVTNGDSVSGTLREAGVPGRVLTWAEVLHDGPVPAGTPEELRRIRARHLADRGWADAADAERQFAERERLLASHAGGRYVLWFEADLFDQLLLLQVLDALSRLGGVPRARPRRAGRDHPRPLARAPVPRRGVRPPAAGVPVADGQTVADAAPHPARRCVRRRARGADLPRDLAAGAAAVPRRRAPDGPGAGLALRRATGDAGAGLSR